MRKVYRSRVSALLLVFLLAVFIPVSLPAIRRGNIAELCVVGAIFLFPVLLLTGTRYIITPDRLYIKLWFIGMGSIKIRDIESVRRSYNMLSSPAASLKRLGVKTIGKTSFPAALISPAREREFLESLMAINPRIDIQVSDKNCVWRFWDWDI